jgi:hypothetical protein
MPLLRPGKVASRCDLVCVGMKTPPLEPGGPFHVKRRRRRHDCGARTRSRLRSQGAVPAPPRVAAVRCDDGCRCGLSRPFHVKQRTRVPAVGEPSETSTPATHRGRHPRGPHSSACGPLQSRPAERPRHYSRSHGAVRDRAGPSSAPSTSSHRFLPRRESVLVGTHRTQHRASIVLAFPVRDEDRTRRHGNCVAWEFGRSSQHVDVPAGHTRPNGAAGVCGRCEVPVSGRSGGERHQLLRPLASVCADLAAPQIWHTRWADSTGAACFT